MQFLIILLSLLLVSFVLAYRSLRHMLTLTEVGDVKRELFKKKVIFKNDYSSGDDSSSLS
jgi:hypothetical protein